MADFTDNSGTGHLGRVTGNRDVVAHPSLLKWAYEGKLFTAGLGPEHAGVSGQSSLDDESPEAALVASSSSTTLVLPILLRCCTHTEGGAAAKLYIAVTRAAADCATTMVVSGTAFTAIQNHNVTYTASPTAATTYTCTSTALTNADYQCILLAQQADNPTSGTGGLGLNEGCGMVLELLKTPRILHSGAALLIYPYTGNATIQKWTFAITWAELTADDLI